VANRSHPRWRSHSAGTVARVLETDGEHGPAGDDDTATTTRSRTSIAPTRDLIVLAGAVLLCVAFAPIFVSAPYSPRFAILLGFLPIGLVALVSLCLRRDIASIAATAFVVVGVVSSLLSDHVRISLLGQMGKEASALLLAAFLGWWAIGRHLSARGRSLLPYALLIGFGINALVAFLQVIFDTNTDSEFGVTGGARAIGLTANPVQLGALMAAGAVIAGTFVLTSSAGRWWMWLFATAAFTGAANISGTRIAMLAIGIVLISLMLLHRTWRAAALVGAVVLGVIMSNLLLSTSTSGASSTARIDAGFDRSSVWIYAVKSFVERPLFGFGPGGFRGATQGRYTAEFVRTVANDELHVVWFDAHNVAIEYLVATGIIGVALLAVFGWFAVRRARGPLFAAFVAIGITWLLQPLSVSTAPIALLCLGASAPALVVRDERARASVARGVIAGAAVLGTLLGAGYAFVDLRLDAAVRSDDAVRIEDAARWFPRDAVVADVVAQGWANAFLYHGADKSQLLVWSGAPAEREPDRPYWWSKYAGTQIAFKDYEGARESLDRAIALQPWSPTAWPLMLRLAEKTKDAELQALATEKVCELQLDSCPTTGG
jgi:O-antigen ligase